MVTSVKNVTLRGDNAFLKIKGAIAYGDARITGSAASAVFTPTVSEGWTDDELIGKWAFFFKSGADTVQDVQEITDNDATTVTVGTDIPATYDTLVIMDDEYNLLEGRTDLGESKTADELDATDADSSNRKEYIPGYVDGDITVSAHNTYQPVKNFVEECLEQGVVMDAIWSHVEKSGYPQYAGTLSCTAASPSSNFNDVKTVDFTFRPSEAPTKTLQS